MSRSTKVKVFILLIQLAVIMVFISAGIATAADAITLAASEPAVIYYTTNGATPAAPVIDSSVTPSVLAAETISLVPDAGKGKSYVKPQKLKIHESKYEFEKHLKQKHGKRFRVESFRVKQTESGPEGHIYIIENKDPAILQLGERCTEEEWARRVAVAREFILNNPDLIGLTENEELQVLTRERQNCGNIYFDRFVNGYEFLGSGFRFGFVPQFNYTASVDLDPITPEMYTEAQQQALSEEDIANIVYKDLNIPITGKDGKRIKNLPKLDMRKYLRNREPYAYWRVAYENVYEIDAITGEIAFKQPNVRY